MPVINTTQAFTLRLDDGRELLIPAGESEQPPEIADHWFVNAYLVGTPKTRLPVVEGPDGVMIEADEAGQRVHEGAQLDMVRRAGHDLLRAEGPFSNQAVRNPNAVAAAEEAAAPVADRGAARDRRAAAARTGRPGGEPAPAAIVPDQA